MGKRKVSAIKSIGKPDNHVQERMKLDLYCTPYAIINLKCITDLNIRPEYIKLLEENLEKGSMTLALAMIVFFYYTKSTVKKSKN